MQIQLKTKYCDRPAVLEWGEYSNANAPWQEVALVLRDAETGEPLMKATRSLAEFDVFALPECLMLHVNGANTGLFDCLKDQGVIVGAGSLIPLGDEMFVTAVPTREALADLRFALANPPKGPLN